MKKKYLINGFGIHFKNLENYIPYKMDIFFPKPFRFDILTNYFSFLLSSSTWKFQKYYIIHINTWENFLNYWNRKWKIIIGESHWFHFWLNFSNTLKHFKGIKKIIAIGVNFLLRPLIEHRIKKLDLYYVATPNMLVYAKKIRSDAKWLPNAIDFDVFSWEGAKAEMIWDPVIFYPTRIHSFKNPKFGIDLFHKIKKKYPNAVLHMIHYPNGGDILYSKYRKELNDSNHYVWHSFKTKYELADMFRASDIVLWHFHPDLWMMSLIELQAIACDTAVISYDKYEIKTYLNDLETITFDILRDNNLYNTFVSKNKEIVLKNHNPKSIAKTLQQDISRVKNNIYTKKASQNLIKKNIKKILEIEQEYFSDIWVWDESNFMCKYHNKFDCSYLLYKWEEVIWYIFWYCIWEYWYINRIAILNNYSGQWLWNYLINCFQDNLQYIFSVKFIELVTHDSLKIDSFYRRDWYKEYTSSDKVIEFLKRKWKKESLDKYIWKDKSMKIYYKNI